jgi:hypothetical protein
MFINHLQIFYPHFLGFRLDPPLFLPVEWGSNPTAGGECALSPFLITKPEADRGRWGYPRTREIQTLFPKKSHKTAPFLPECTKSVMVTAFLGQKRAW